MKLLAFALLLARGRRHPSTAPPVMQAEAGRMVELLQQRPLDQAAILGPLDRILDLERRVEKLHFSLLVRIKSTLNVSQLENLDKLRAQP